MDSFLFYTDEVLIDSLREGNPQAFECIYNRYWSILYHQAYKRLKSKESTEELIQDLFTDLWHRRQDLLIKSSLEAYLRTSVKYLVIQYFQKQQVRNRYWAYYQSQEEPATSCTEEVVALHELESALQQQVSSLSPQSKLVYELSREHHLSIAEIARKLNISEKTAENHLGRALKVLRRSLKDYVTMLIFFLLQ